MFRTIGIVSRIDRDEAVSLASTITRMAEGRGLDVILEDGLAQRIGRKGLPLGELDADLAVVIGGDGTVLRAVHGLRKGTPLYAVRVGRVGFLADVDPADAMEGLGKVLGGEFIRDECFMLSNNFGLPDALNEVRVGSETPSQMVELGVSIDGFPVAEDRMDAVLVATSTGSSAYTLSAGGAVLDPRLKAIVIVPVCPLSPNFKPYVIPWDSRVSIKLPRDGKVIALVDGQFQKGLEGVEAVEVWRSRDSVTFLRTEHNFYKRLRRRLGTSSLPPYP